MALAVRGYPETPYERIINVQWASPFVVLSFISEWKDESAEPTEQDAEIEVAVQPAEKTFEMFEDVVEVKIPGSVVPFDPIVIIKSTSPYNEKEAEDPTKQTVTRTDYFLLWTHETGAAFVSAMTSEVTEVGQPTVIQTVRMTHLTIPPTVPEDFISSSSGPTVEGDIHLWIATFLADNGGTSLSIESTIGPVTDDPGDAGQIVHKKNALIMFKLSPIRGLIKKLPIPEAQKTKMIVEFTTPLGPALGDEPVDPNYKWEATLFSFKSGNFTNKFPVDDENKPLDPVVDNWPKIVDTKTVSNPTDQVRTPSMLVRFTVDLKTYEIEGTSEEVE